MPYMQTKYANRMPYMQTKLEMSKAVPLFSYELLIVTPTRYSYISASISPG